ncbi:hypothetical protein QBC39DRAFT_384307 [Podospora conica]|nr:hypothetical protein QBC39DRAFT_384307 [Schizothecium conicum]
MPPPAPAPALEVAAAGPTDTGPDRHPGFKGFLTRLAGSQSHTQIQLRKKPEPIYGPVLPLTEEVVQQLKGPDLTEKERNFQTAFTLKTRYNEHQDNRHLAEPSVHPPTRPYPNTLPGQPLPIHYILSDPHFNILEYYPMLGLHDPAPDSPSEYPEDEHWEAHAPPPSQWFPDTEAAPPPSQWFPETESGPELLQQAVYQADDYYTTHPSCMSGYPLGPLTQYPDDMDYGTPEQCDPQGHDSREPIAMAEDKAIHGNFIPVSHSQSRMHSRTRSKHKKSDSYETILRLSLTDAQVNKITSVLSKEDETPQSTRGSSQRDRDARTTPQSTSRSRSPEKQSKTSSGLRRARSPNKRLLGGKTGSGNTIESYGKYEFEPEADEADNVPRKSHSLSPSKSTALRSAMKQQSSSMMERSPSPQRAHRAPPAPIDTNIARQHAAQSTQRKNPNGGPTVIHRPPFESRGAPTTAVHFSNSAFSHSANSQCSSQYSPDFSRYPSHISPLRINKAKPPAIPLVPEIGSYPMAQDELSPGSDLPTSSILFSRFPGERKTSKTMIGHNGWLERTTTAMSRTGLPGLTGETAAKKPRFFDGMLKKAKGIIKGDIFDKSSRDSHSKAPGPRALAISLSPREQSIVTNELEYAMTGALAQYLTDQFNGGRIDAAILKRGRPRVVGFRFDLETQLELVRLHIQEFKFYGHAATKTAVLGVLDMATTNARVLRVRTFCQPDTVLAKQLLDAQAVFNLLGCPDEQQWALAEVTAYYKAAIERETAGVKAKEHEKMQEEEAARLRHVKSVSGEKWHQTNPGCGVRGGGGQQGLRKTASHTGLRMDPTEYESEEY